MSANFDLLRIKNFIPFQTGWSVYGPVFDKDCPIKQERNKISKFADTLFERNVSSTSPENLRYIDHNTRKFLQL